MSRFTILIQAIPPSRRTGIWRYTDEVLRRLVRIADVKIVPVSFEGPRGPGWTRYYARMLLKQYLVRPDGPVHSMSAALVPPETEILTLYDLIPFFRAGMNLQDRLLYRSLVWSITHYPREWVAITDPVRRAMIEKLRLPPAHVHLAPPGIDTEVFRPNRETGKPNGPTVILHVGIGYARKGIDTLVEALTLLGARRFRLVRLGPVQEEDYMASCRERAADVGLSFVELGRVSDSQLAAWYNRADLLAFPSRDEGGGIPLIEAMACGTNVVTSDLPAHRYLCGSLARYSRPGDPDDLARAIGEALATPIARDALVAHARRFTWEATARVYADLYDSFLGR